MRLVPTVCPRDCYDTCFLLAEVRGDRVVRVRGDPASGITRGFTCARGAADHLRLYRNRVLYPYVRDGRKPGRRFRRASWDEALDLFVERLEGVVEERGKGAVLHVDYAGNMGLLTWYFPLRLWNFMGSASTDYSICSRSGHEALALHYGLSYGAEPEEVADARLVVFWGFNAAVSSPHLWALALESRRGGGFVVSIDPRRSETSSRSDLWVAPRPGSDVALAYGVMYWLVRDGFVDEGFVERWTLGYDRLLGEVEKWGPERVEAVTGVPGGAVRRLARLYGERRPSVTLIGLGMQKGLAGAESVRAVSLIPALLGVHRGFYYSNSRGWLVDLDYVSGLRFWRPSRVVSQVGLADLVARGEFGFVFVFNMNPLLTLTGQGALRRGLMRDDVFMVVHDTHWTETADYADLVLPAPTFLEKEDVVISYSHGYVRLSRRVVKPLGESLEEYRLMFLLAERLGFRDSRLFEDPWSVLEKAFENAFEDGSFEDLLEGRVLRLRSRGRSEYQTPSGKIELWSSVAEERGLSPLPEQLDVGEGGFVLLNSATLKYTHTQFREVYGEIPAVVHVNPVDAEKLGLGDGDLVVLYNELGRVLLKARLSGDVPEGAVWAPRQLKGLDGTPLNVLIPTAVQKIGGGPVFNSVRVWLRRAGG